MDESVEAEGLSSENELLLACLASRMVQESELEDVYAGPLGQLLFTQCERSRPKSLREVALRLFRRIRDLTKISEELAEQYFRMQQETVCSLFECAGIGAALALNIEFIRQWGPRLMPWLEQPLFTALHEAVLGCVSADKQRLPLLEVFALWVRSDDFMKPERRRDLANDVKKRCREVGLDPERMESVTKFVQRALPSADTALAPATASACVPGAANPLPIGGLGLRPGVEYGVLPDDFLVPRRSAVEASPRAATPTYRISGKRPIEEVEALERSAARGAASPGRSPRPMASPAELATSRADVDSPAAASASVRKRVKMRT